MIKKYEFQSQAQAYQLLKATPTGDGFLKIKGAENAVDLGHYVISPAVYEDGKEVTPAALSVGYLVDVMWFEKSPKALTPYEVNPETPKHTFA